MRKNHDYIHEYRGIWRDGGRCRIDVYEPGAGEMGRPVVVCSEVPDNDNTSVTNACELIAAEVIARHFPHLLDQPAGPEGCDQPVRWLEHYPAAPGAPQEYDLVTFTPWRIGVRTEGGIRRALSTPHWRRLAPSEVATLLGEASGGEAPA